MKKDRDDEGVRGEKDERETWKDGDGKREPYISASRIEVTVVLVSNIPVSRVLQGHHPPIRKTVETCELKVPRAACKFPGSKFRVFPLAATAPGTG